MDNEPATYSPVVELAFAYEDVFGREGKRSSSQQKVWDDLLACSYHDDTTCFYTKTGEVDVNKMLLFEGRRAWILDIKRFLRTAANPPQPKPKK